MRSASRGATAIPSSRTTRCAYSWRLIH